METFAKVWAKLPNGSQIPLRPTSAREFEELGYQRVHEVRARSVPFSRMPSVRSLPSTWSRSHALREFPPLNLEQVAVPCPCNRARPGMVLRSGRAHPRSWPNPRLRPRLRASIPWWRTASEPPPRGVPSRRREAKALELKTPPRALESERSKASGLVSLPTPGLRRSKQRKQPYLLKAAIPAESSQPAESSHTR